MIYDGYFKVALIQIWEILDHPCGQRLVFSLRETDIVDKLRKLGELECSDAVAEKLKRVGSTTIDKKGKQKKIDNIYQTPYERFKSLPNAEQYLKPGITFEMLDKIVYQKSDNEFAALMQKAKDELFNNFSRHKLQFPTVYTTFISSSYVD